MSESSAVYQIPPVGTTSNPQPDAIQHLDGYPILTADELEAGLAALALDRPVSPPTRTRMETTRARLLDTTFSLNCARDMAITALYTLGFSNAQIRTAYRELFRILERFPADCYLVEIEVTLRPCHATTPALRRVVDLNLTFQHYNGVFKLSNNHRQQYKLRIAEPCTGPTVVAEWVPRLAGVAARTYLSPGRKQRLLRAKAEPPLYDYKTGNTVEAVDALSLHDHLGRVLANIQAYRLTVARHHIVVKELDGEQRRHFWTNPNHRGD